MAEGSHGAADVNEMFQKMAQKLGWFHNKQNVPSDPVSQVRLPGVKKKKETKPMIEGRGAEKKLTKKKEQSTKTSKVRKKANVDSADIPKSSETTPAHSKVPKLLGSAGFSSSGKTKLINPGQKNPGKNGEYRTKLDFDFSSSDDDDFQQIPGRRTPAHTNLPKDLGLTGGCKKDTNIQTPDFDDPKDELSRSCKTVLKGFDLSSSEDELEPEGTFPKSAANNAKPAESKPSRAKVSDSFVEQVEEVEDTFVSCVGESFVDQHDIPKTSQFEKEEFRKPTLSQKYNFSADDTIVQKPIHISPESFSPDMDTTFGQPPCESTRIHRRSSVSYKKLLGSPEDISSEASDDNKHYETCRPNVSGDEDNDEPEDPFSVTACEVQRNENLGKKSSDEKPKPMDNEMKSDTDNSNNKKNNDLCEELHNLSLHQHDSPSDSQAVKSRKITDNIAPDNGYELKGTSSEQNFDEIIEVIDVYTQTEQSMCEDDLSPLKQSLGERGLSENTWTMVRKKSSSSIQSVTESKSDSDASEVEIKDISIQTDIRSDISEVDSNIDISIKDNDRVSPVKAIISHAKIEVTVVTSDSDKEECLSENESNCDNSEHRKDADRDNSASSEIKINERRNSDSGENASNISDIESSGESNSEPDVLSSESEDRNRNNDKKKLLKLKRKGTHKTGKGRTSNVVDDVSDDSEKYGNHLPDSLTATEVKDAARNTWRKKLSESSSDEDLEAYFEKLRNPKTTTVAKSSSQSSSSSEASPVSMKDFIVDDDDITSESDDNAFYIEENRKLDESPLNDRPKTSRPTTFVDFSNSDDSDFTTDKYPGSVTKHKKRTNKPKTRSKSWSLSDEESEDDGYPSSKPSKTKHLESKDERDIDKTVPKTDKKCKTEHWDKNDNKEREIGIKGVSDTSLDVKDEILFKTPKPLTRVPKKTSNKENMPNELFKTPKSSRETAGVFKTPKFDPDNEGIFKTPKSINKVKTPNVKESKKASEKSKTEVKFITLFDSDDDSEDLPDITPSVLREVNTNTKVKSKSLTDKDLLRTPSSVVMKSKINFYTPQPVQSKYSFLKSLSTVVQEHRRDPEAARFVTGFKKNKEELSPYLFRLYNRTVFDNQLPSDLPIEWNKRLLRTAGYCTYKKSSKNPDDRSAKIELSTKVCDSAERVRDTLIHELCHAAVWLINGTRDGHGRYWKYWARKANHAHPEIPVIARCHDYSINTKYTYRCKQCGYSIGRHSKSLDTEKKVCGYCHGQFELQQNSSSLSSSGSVPVTPKTPRPPNRFALYVKEHYGSVKKDKNLKHGDVMKELSKQFAEMNKI